MNFTKTDDLKGGDKAIEALDLTPFVGKWSNTKTNSGQVPYVELRIDNDKLILKAFGAGSEGLIDWGETECEVFATSTHEGTAIAFLASYVFDEIDVEISANVKLGVLVFQTYTRFKDGSKRLNYYTREFYGPAQS